MYIAVGYTFDTDSYFLQCFIAASCSCVGGMTLPDEALHQQGTSGMTRDEVLQNLVKMELEALLNQVSILNNSKCERLCLSLAKSNAPLYFFQILPCLRFLRQHQPVLCIRRSQQLQLYNACIISACLIGSVVRTSTLIQCHQDALKVHDQRRMSYLRCARIETTVTMSSIRC